MEIARGNGLVRKAELPCTRLDARIREMRRLPSGGADVPREVQLAAPRHGHRLDRRHAATARMPPQRADGAARTRMCGEQAITVSRSMGLEQVERAIGPAFLYEHLRFQQNEGRRASQLGRKRELSFAGRRRASAELVPYGLQWGWD